MRDRLKDIETPYIDAQTLLYLYADYQKPRERILNMVKNGQLIRLKNGFYLLKDKIQHKSGTVIPYEQVANLLYGPSYVSLEWALSFYGIIPERVHTITSMTLGRNKSYSTPIGDFSYHMLAPSKYFIGVTHKNTADGPGGFMIATPEKALADLVYITCKKLSKDQLYTELLESRRIEREVFHSLNKDLLYTIRQAYSSKIVKNFVDLVGVL